MKTHSPLFLLGALGVLSAAAGAAAVDTSQWKCETCPFDKPGAAGVVEAGVGAVTDDSGKAGDFTGLKRKGAYLVAAGSARFRNDSGLSASVQAADLGLASRSLAAEIDQEGLYTVRLGYAEIPHYLSDTATSPFIGSGGAVLTLPAGFPANDTAAMPLATTSQPVTLGFKRSRFDAGVAWTAGEHWTHRVSLRHDVRDGTQRASGSFFSSAAHLVTPIDQITDQLEVSTSYFSARLQASLAYQVSLFNNGADSLTWVNPFTAVVAGATRGQLALAPDNQFHQIVGSAAYEVLPQLRASADVAVGRMTQDAGFLAATLNTSEASLVAAAQAMPAPSLNGKVDTFNASVRLSATPIERLRVNASYTRDVRDNRTASLAYPAISTDVFVGATPRSNPSFSFTQDRVKLSADYRGPERLKTSLGVEQNNIQRTLQEVVDTRETTVWARVALQPLETLSLSLKLLHAERSHSSYGVATWVSPAENPLMRKYNLAERKRDSASVRADFTIAETVSLGLNAQASNDDYANSIIGLSEGRSASLGADLSWTVTEQTQLHAFVQGEQMRSRQAGSQVFALPDWSGQSKDAIDLFGLGLKHRALKGKLELAADLTFARSRSDVTVDAGVNAPGFPRASTARDSLKLQASYKLQDNLTISCSGWYERYDAQDWRYDGVGSATIPNLLAFGETPPRYHAGGLAVAMRYRF